MCSSPALPTRGFIILNANTFSLYQFPKEESEGEETAQNKFALISFSSRKQNWPPELACNYFLPLHKQEDQVSGNQKEDKGARVLRSERMKPKGSWEAERRSSPSILTCRLDPGACC